MKLDRTDMCFYLVETLRTINDPILVLFFFAMVLAMSQTGGFLSVCGDMLNIVMYHTLIFSFNVEGETDMQKKLLEK